MSLAIALGGIPVCTTSDCPQYCDVDGGRCKISNHLVGPLCEPTVLEMVNYLIEISAALESALAGESAALEEAAEALIYLEDACAMAYEQGVAAERERSR